MKLRGPQFHPPHLNRVSPRGRAIKSKDRMSEVAQAAQGGACQSRLKAWLWGQQAE